MKLYVENWNNCIPELPVRYTENINKCDALLIWNDELDDMRKLIDVVRKRGVPSFVMQHGAACPVCFAGHGIYGTFPDRKAYADFMFIWGERWRETVKYNGWADEHIISVGCPILTNLPARKSDGITIVFAPEHADTPERNVINGQLAKKIWDKLNALTGIRPVIKLLEGEHNPEFFQGEKVITNRHGKGHVNDSLAMLASARCLVTMSCETMALQAEALGVPVIVCKDEAGIEQLGADISYTFFDNIPKYCVKDKPINEIIGPNCIDNIVDAIEDRI